MAATFVGTTGNDLFGNGTPNFQTYNNVYGLDGNDTIYGYYSGNMLIVGGSGNDSITFNSSSITGGTVIGGSGSDFITGVGVQGYITGEFGTDTAAADYFVGGTSGPNTIIGAGSFDTLFGGAGSDSITGSTVATSLNYIDGGSGGSDTLIGGGASDTIVGNGPDSMVGSNNAGAVNYFYDLWQGSTTMQGGTGAGGANYFMATGGADHIFGGNGTDFVYLSEWGNDTYTGANGNDVISDSTSQGTVGHNLINTGNGNDTVWATQANNDTIFGGSGNDVIFGGGAAGTVTQITGGSGNDTINGQLDQGILYVTPGTGSGTNFVTGDNYSNHIYGGGTTGSLWMRGGTGEDEMIGGSGSNHFIGEGGGDFMTGGGTSNAFMFNSPSEGNDHINNFNTNTDIIAVDAQNFAGLTGGETLTVGHNLINGAAPVAHTATFFYTHGALYFDADGTGSAAAPTLIAGLVNAPAALNPSNFFISSTAF